MKMRTFLIASTIFLVTGSPYGPPPAENEVLPSKTNTDCSSIDGCSNESNQILSTSKFSSGGNRFPQEVNVKATGGRPYWWEGQNNPFKGGCTSGTAGCLSYTPGKVLLPSSSSSNKVVNSFGVAGGLTSATSGSAGQCVCPSSFACVNWQFCQDGVMIVDGSVSIDQSKTSIPAQVSSAFGSCGKNMICCRIPTCEGVVQASSFQTSSKFSHSQQSQNVPISHFPSTEPHSVDDSNFGIGVLHAQQGSNKFSQTHTTLPDFGSSDKQKTPHFTEISTESKKPISSLYDSIGDHSVQSGTFHSSQKIPGIREIPSEFAVFTHTPAPERVEPELDIDDISGYLPPSAPFQSGQSQLQSSLNRLKPETTKFSKPTLPEQGTKFTSPSVVSHGKPDQTVQVSGTVHQTKQPLKPHDKDEERRPSHFAGKPDQNKYYEENSKGSINDNLPLTPQLTKPFKPILGDSHAFTPQADFERTGQILIEFPTSPIQPGLPSRPVSHKFGDSQYKESTVISDQVGSTKETKFQGSQYKPGASAQQPDQTFQSGSFGSGHSTIISGQTEKTKESQFPTSQYQPDQPTHLGSLEFQSGQYSQSNIGKIDHQAKPDHTLSIASPAASKPADEDSSFPTQSQQQHFTGGFGDSSSSSSGNQGSQFETGQSQGRPDSTFSSGSTGIKGQPSTHGLSFHSQTSQSNIGGSFGGSSFSSGTQGSQHETGHSQGRPDSTFSSGSTGIKGQPSTHGLSSHSQTSQSNIGGSFGGSSFSSGTQGSGYKTGHSQGRPDSTFSSGTSGIKGQPSTHGLSSHSQTSQSNTGGSYGGSSFSSGTQGSQYETGHSQGRPDSKFSSGTSGLKGQPSTHGLASQSQTSQSNIGGGFGSTSFDAGHPGSQFQFSQSHINAGTGFDQPSHPAPTNAQGSGVNLHGTGSSTFDRVTPSNGIISGAGTQPSAGMGGMMMMMGPMLVGGKMMLNGEVMKTVSGNPLISGSCSAGQFCLPKADCNPYNGFIILYANQQVAASFPNAPTVPLLGCHIGGISDSESFCCQLPHPLLGPDGKPFD